MIDIKNDDLLMPDDEPQVEPVAKASRKSSNEAKAERDKVDAAATRKALLGDKVTIILEDPGTGNMDQFFGLNGKGYLLKFNEPVTIPRELLNVMDEAVETKTIPLPEGGFSERQFKRFPYRIVGKP